MSDDLYAELNLTPDANARDIKKAYFGLVRQFPPETHAEQFQKLRAAYEVLSNEETRKAYDASRGAAASEQLGDELAVIMRSALEAIEAREFERAVPLLEGVVKERPEAEEARGRLCSCLLALGRLGEAATHAGELARHHPTLAQAPLLLGYAAQGLKHFHEARTHFLRAGELAPQDFRPVRSLVDVDLEANDGEAALVYLDQRLTTAPESMRLGLRMERVSVLHHLERLDEAAKALAALEAEATTAELKEELGWFYEREAASLFARKKHAHADALLARLAALAPSRGSVALTRPVTLPLSALPESARTWLAAQRQNPELFSFPGVGVVADSVMALGATGLFCGMALLAFMSDSQWSTGELVFVCTLFAGAGALQGATLLRWVRSLKSPLGRFSAIHRLFYVDVGLDEVRFIPMVRLSHINATHQGNNGVYTHTTFGLSFGPEGHSFSISSQQRAEDLAQLLHQLRGRLLDLLHSGMLAGEEGADFLPAALLLKPPARAPQRHRLWTLAGAGLGVVLALSASVVAQRAFEDQRWLDTQGDQTPRTLRQYLAGPPPARFKGPAEAALAKKKAAALQRLQAGAPLLARALEAQNPGEATPLFLDLSGEATPATLAAPAGSKLAELPASEFLATGRQRHEDELIAALQSKVDQLAGVGWFVLKRGAGPLTLKFAYQLSLSGNVYRYKTPNTPLTLLWPEAKLAGTATFGEVQRNVIAVPAREVSLSQQAISAILKGDSSTASTLVFDAAWAELGTQLSSVLFSSAG